MLRRWKSQTIILFVLLNSPFWVLFFLWPRALRLCVIALALTAMWSLWVARRERKHLWTTKLADIWMVQMLWCVAAVEGNLEFWYKHTDPSWAVLLVVGILWLTVKGVFNGEKYTVDQP